MSRICCASLAESSGVEDFVGVGFAGCSGRGEGDGDFEETIDCEIGGLATAGCGKCGVSGSRSSTGNNSGVFKEVHFAIPDE
jgi:hypothetical protein